MRVSDKILSIIEEANPSHIEAVTTSNLYTDLGFDSLAFMLVIIKIEEAFSISIGIMEISPCLQVDTLIALVKSKVKEAGYDSATINRPYG